MSDSPKNLLLKFYLSFWTKLESGMKKMNLSYQRHGRNGPSGNAPVRLSRFSVVVVGCTWSVEISRRASCALKQSLVTCMITPAPD